MLVARYRVDATLFGTAGVKGWVHLSVTIGHPLVNAKTVEIRRSNRASFVCFS